MVFKTLIVCWMVVGDVIRSFLYSFALFMVIFFEISIFVMLFIVNLGKCMVH